MKNIKKISLVLLGIILVTACGKKETPEEREIKLCDKIDSYVEKYEKGNLSFSELSTELDKLYKDDCKETSDTCNAINTVSRANNQESELRDCSTYTDPTIKAMCEKNNELVQKEIQNKDDVQKASVNELKRKCALAREKK